MSKISWPKALVDYLKDETQSYASIARKHGVSLQAVKKRAAKEGWQDLRQRSIQKVNQRLPEITGEVVAMIDARQAQIGKMLQYIGLKAIVEKRLTPENFTQAKESIKDGAKIEREAIDAGTEERKRKELYNILNRERIKYGFDDDSEEVKKQKLPNSIKKPVQIAPNTPAIDPQLLAEVQRRLEDIKKRVDRL